MGRFRYSRRHGSVPPGVVAAVAAGLLMAGTAGASATHHSGGGSGVPSRTAQTAVSYAEAQTGKPYVYGAPRYIPGAPAPAAFDCSSLVQWAWAAAGITIPGTSETQWAELPHVTENQLRPGDLIFYTGSPIDPPPGHVTMYIGGGQMVEAYETGYPVRDTPVRPGATGYAQPGGGS